jgi:hypothetical protein
VLVLLSGTIVLVLLALGQFVVERQGNLGWDDADYLARGLRLARTIESDGPSAIGLIIKERPKPPWLIGWVEMMALIVGRQRFDTLLVLSSVLPYGLLLVASAAIAGRMAGRVAAILAVLALAASPMGLAFGAKVMVETFMGLWVLGLYWGLARSLVRPTAARAAFLGGACGLAALTKLTVVLFAAGPAVYVAHRCWRHGPGPDWRRRAAALGLAFAIPVGIIAGPWYARNAAATIQFARFSAQFDRARTGGQGPSQSPRWTRPVEQMERVAGWPVVLALPIALVGWRRRGPSLAGADHDAEAVEFTRVTQAGLAAGSVMLLVPSYHDVRFLLPIWPSVAIVLAIGWTRAVALVSGAYRSILVAGLASGLTVAVAFGHVQMRGQQGTRTYWAAARMIDHMVETYHVKVLGNLGNGADWNVCKTCLINETRDRPGTCIVQHDLSKLDPGPFAQLAGRLDAVVVLDRSAIDPAYLTAAPAMNRGHASLPLLETAEWSEATDLPAIDGLPPLRVFVRRQRLAQR